jgi:hypothetical protein
MSLPAVAGLLLVIDLSTDPFAPELPSVTKTVAQTVTSLLFPVGVVGMTATVQAGAVLSILIGPKNAGGSRGCPQRPCVADDAVRRPGGAHGRRRIKLATPDWFAPSSVVERHDDVVVGPASCRVGQGRLLFVVVAVAVATGSAVDVDPSWGCRT